jgi:hypothetical protein
VIVCWGMEGNSQLMGGVQAKSPHTRRESRVTSNQYLVGPMDRFSILFFVRRR